MSFGDKVTQTIDILTDEMLEDKDFIISFGYRYIIPLEIVERFKGKAINLHISYLPYNRGADPNLWSFLEDTPKGVTIHWLEKGIDTGDIIEQRHIVYNVETDTLRTTYARLMKTMEGMFKDVWQDIREGTAKSVPQMTYHGSKDKITIELPQGFDTPIKELIGRAKNENL